MDEPSSSDPPSGDATPAGLRLRAYATDQLAIAIDCLGWRNARLHAGVHQARKSIRRARAAIALGGDTLGPGARFIDRQLQRVNRSLSTMRDAQALVEALARLAARQKHAGAAPLFKRAQRAAGDRRAARAREEMHADPAFTGKRAVLRVLAAGLQALPWQDLREPELLAALERSASRAEAASRSARSAGHDDDWHRWRRRARRLSQQHRALGELAAVIAVAMDDKALAVRLGEAQDHALLIGHCGAGSPFKDGDRPALRSLARKGLKRARGRIAKAANQPRPLDAGE